VLFLAGGVELRERGNGRHLPQQPQPIETPLLNGTGRPRQLRRPAHLVQDLPDELTDLLGGTFGLQTQNADLQCPHPVVLLRVRCDRAQRGRTADKGDEIPASHMAPPMVEDHVSNTG
jgi:hypothetical protein